MSWSRPEGFKTEYLLNKKWAFDKDGNMMDWDCGSWEQFSLWSLVFPGPYPCINNCIEQHIIKREIKEKPEIKREAIIILIDVLERELVI